MAEAGSAGRRFGRRHRDRSAAGLVTQDSNRCVHQCVKGLNQRNETDMHESQQRPLRSCPQDQESYRRRRDSRDYLMDGQISALGLVISLIRFRAFGRTGPHRPKDNPVNSTNILILRRKPQGQHGKIVCHDAQWAKQGQRYCGLFNTEPTGIDRNMATKN